MEALDAAGDRGAALKHAAIHVELLKSDLGAAPDPAVAALAERLRRDPAARARMSVLTNAVRSIRDTPNEMAPPLRDAAPSDRSATPHPAGDGRREHANFARVLTSAKLGGDVGAARSAESRHGLRLARVAARTCGIAVAIAGLAFGVTMSRRPTADALVRFSVDLGAGLGLAGGPAPLALAPNGQTLAFVANREDGEPRLYVRSLTEMRPRECTGTEGASQPFFSPDGRWIGFYAAGYLKKVPLAGGEPRVIGRVHAMRGAAWASNNFIVVSTAGSLGVIPAAGGTLRRISAPDTSSGEIAQRWPMLMHDGTIVYTASGRILEESRIAVLSADGRREILGLNGGAPLGLLDGLLMYASARNPGTETNAIMAVAWDRGHHRATGAATTVVDDVAIDVQGAAAAAISPNGSLAYVLRSGIRRRVILADDRGGRHVLTANPGAYAFPRFSPDGKRIALNLVGPPYDNEVRVLDRASGALTPLTANRAGYPEWTPDGKRILYLRPPGNGGLWWRSVDLGSPDSLLLRNDSLDVKEGVLSRDGTTLVVRVNNIRTYARELWFRLMSGDTLLRPLVRDNALNAGPRISPDGRWVAYGSNELGNDQVYVVPLTGHAPRYRISTDHGWAPMWSPDGRRLYYVRGRQLIAATLRFAPSFEVSSRRVVLDGGFDSQQAYHAHYDVSLNGELVFVEDVSPASPVVFVQGWTRELGGRGTLVVAK
jgi:serine/threonine-protein kinase